MPGAGEDGMSGTVVRLSVKARGPGEHRLPKAAVTELLVSRDGAAGDYNRYRSERLGGDRDQALLIITRDMLDGLALDGWPVQPGDLGENLTVDGIAESSLVPGARLRSGAVLVEVTRPCDPCDEVYSLPYVGKDRGPGFVKQLVGRRGWFARVLEPGTIVPGAPISIDRR